MKSAFSELTQLPNEGELDLQAIRWLEFGTQIYASESRFLPEDDDDTLDFVKTPPLDFAFIDK